MKVSKEKGGLRKYMAKKKSMPEGMLMKKKRG